MTLTDPNAVYRAVAPYEPVHGDEIRLSVGDRVLVLHSYDDGWVLGKNCSSNSVGLLPNNFITPENTRPPSTVNASNSKPVAAERRSSLVVRTRQLTSNTQPAESVWSANSSNSAAKNEPNDSSLPRKNSPVLQRRSSEMSKELPVKEAKEPPKPLPLPTVDATKQKQAQEKLLDIASKRQGRALTPSNIGSIKISIVGDSGIGKSSFISTFQRLPEIKASQEATQFKANIAFQQYLASTIAPDEVHLGEDAHNLTFIEAPGYGSTMDALDIILPVLEYHQQQFTNTDSVFVKDVPQNTLVKYLRSGCGAHSHVDVCIYGILHRITQVDLEYIRKLSAFVNVVPVILKCDTLSTDELFNLKATILEKLIQANINVYGFGLNLDECYQLAKANISGAVPFAFASSAAVERGVRPGSGESEFEELKNKVLYEFIDDLRSLGAEKFTKWRNRQVRS